MRSRLAAMVIMAGRLPSESTQNLCIPHGGEGGVGPIGVAKLSLRFAERIILDPQTGEIILAKVNTAAAASWQWTKPSSGGGKVGRRRRPFGSASILTITGCNRMMARRD